jgi:phosphonate transport system substrate-binding protein
MANPPTVKAGELGSADKPIVITFVPSGDTGKITKAGNAIADCLNQMTGLTYKIQVGTSFGASIEALGANKAQIGFLNTFSALLAQTKYGVTPILAVLRKYSTNAVDPDSALKGQIEPFYKGQFIANQASGVKSFADLKGKTFCFVDPNSTSGYIIPRIVLAANGIKPDTDLKASVNAGSHPNVVIGVYKGDCDAGVTYIDAITDPVANLPAKYPDLTTKVTAFADTARIPNDGVQVVKDLPAPIVQATTDGLLAMAKDPGGNAVLRGLYTIDGFEKIDSTFYQPFLDLLKKAGVDPASLVK